MPAVNYDNKRFILVATSGSGQVNMNTIFHYHQRGDLVWGTYEGGTIRYGMLLATADADGRLDLRYQHLNMEGQLMTGTCISTPVILPDGRIRLEEKWQWTSGDHSTGESAVEEIRE